MGDVVGREIGKGSEGIEEYIREERSRGRLGGEP